MKNMLIAGLALAMSVVAFNACKHDHSKSNTQTTKSVPTSLDTKYICPMNCEKGKTYDQPGTCPVCNMNLEPIKMEMGVNTAE